MTLAALSCVLFLITAATYNALGVVLPRMVKDEGWSWGEAGLGFTLLGVATGGSSLLPRMLIRKAGVQATLACGTAVMAAGLAAIAATRGVAPYFAGAALCGVGFQMVAVIPGTHVLAALYQKRALPFGVYFSSAAMGGVAGPLLALWLMDAFGGRWRLFWLAQMLAILVVGALCTLAVGGRSALEQTSVRTDAALAEQAVAPARGGVWRTGVDWTPAEAFRTPQFYILAGAYFAHLLVGAMVSGVSVAHLTQRGVSVTLAGAMLSLEALMQFVGRSAGGLVGDRVDPKRLLVMALAAMAVGSAALSMARNAATMLVYAVGSGLGFGLTLLAVSVLLLNYFGRRHNLEIFSTTCLVGALSALGPAIGGVLRDATGSFAPTFQGLALIVTCVLVAALFMKPPMKRAAAILPRAAGNRSQ